MKKIKRILLVFLVVAVLFSTVVNVAFADEETVYLGGMPAGFFLESRGAFVAGLCDVITENGLKSPAKDAGLSVGDVILDIDGKEVNNALDIENTLNDDLLKSIVVDRKGKKEEFSVKPATDVNGKLKLGVFIREGVSGIGTVTYIKDDCFGSLGHPVLNDDGSVLDIIKGGIYDCTVTGFVKGERGKPGELRGVFSRRDEKGIINKNNETGVYGKLIQKPDKSDMTEIKTGEGKPGNAFIYTTVDGRTPVKYSVSIIKYEESATKNFVIKITDERLIEMTGGIVQGMSGSPIVQDGKLVGAVTHVFINDPTRGFGISIYNMLNN